MCEEVVEVQLFYLMGVMHDDVVEVVDGDGLLHREGQDDLSLLEVLEVVVVWKDVVPTVAQGR